MFKTSFVSKVVGLVRIASASAVTTSMRNLHSLKTATLSARESMLNSTGRATTSLPTSSSKFVPTLSTLMQRNWARFVSNSSVQQQEQKMKRVEDEGNMHVLRQINRTLSSQPIAKIMDDIANNIVHQWNVIRNEEVNCPAYTRSADGLVPISLYEASMLIQRLNPSWHFSDDGKHIIRTFITDSFDQSVKFLNAINRKIADVIGHPPAFRLSTHHCPCTSNRGAAEECPSSKMLLSVMLTSPSLKGLSLNDFVLAAKIDEMGFHSK